MLSIEAAAMANGWTEEQLLNLAGERLGRAIGRHFPHPGTAVAYLGKGHNAADALVALRILRDEFRWKISIRSAYPPTSCAQLVWKKWDELGHRLSLDRSPQWRDIEGPLILLDGLLGTGSKGRLRYPVAQLAGEMASLRLKAGARVAAIDLPSGIDPDSGEVFPDTVIADVTFMIGSAKRGLLHAHAAVATGALAVVPVEPLSASSSGDIELVSPQTLECGKVPRPFDFHKGQAGRVAILAGSEHYSGAAVLAATGALRGGGGLVTLYVPEGLRAVVSARCPPEIIVRGIRNPRELLEFRYDSLVTGCGLGDMDPSMEDGLLDLISHSPAPTVVDADALNLIAKSGRTDILSEKHILTPHPGEFARLAPDLAELSREDAARRFADRIPAILLLKGSRTLVTGKGAPLYCNSTGTPAMATGGQGDLLAGVIGARLATGDPLLHAAALAAWLCGRAAEIALNERHLSEESVIPSDVIHFLGAAFQDWKTSQR
ncbi:MAG: NAD(P)H-hydrate dehydratase [Verrucomicrobiota bacterium]